MNSSTIIAIAVAVLLVAGLGVVLTSVRRNSVRGMGALSRETARRDRAGRKSRRAATRAAEETASVAVVAAPSAELAPWSPPDPEAIGVSRRQFLNRASVTLMGASLGAFGAAVVGFLWKGASGGFGSKITIGTRDSVIAQIRSGKGFFYVPEARAWITEYPAESLAKAKAIYGSQSSVYGGMEAGIVALYQKCPHLGCRVPECSSSQWFECPCHGSQYNRVGEKKGGPAPRGMDRFGVSISNGSVVVDTGAVFGGPPIGVNTTGQEAEGPHCVGAAGEH
jgi:cytochrome b6-f complex iron-sulfur subunit